MTATGRIANEHIKRQAEAVVRALSQCLIAIDAQGLPQLSFSIGEDGSVAIEWRFQDRRLAFTIETDERESGWHIVFSQSAGGTHAYGPLSGREMRVQIAQALTRVSPFFCRVWLGMSCW